MSALKNAQMTGGLPRMDLLGRLRETQIVDTKPVLPAEILSLILEHLSVLDLVHFARLSKRMREMVYDDTRWVRRLRFMGCWNDAAARTAAEEARRRKLGTLNNTQEHQSKKTAVANGITGAKSDAQAPGGSRIPSVPHVSVTAAHKGTSKSRADVFKQQDGENDGFDFVALSPTTPDPLPDHQPVDTLSALEVISTARSVRGTARQEYGRIHGALNLYYKDALRSKHPSNARIFRVYRDPVQQAAMLAQLVKFANSDLSLGWQAREDKLLLMMSAFEDAVSREFEQGLKLGDVDGRMKKYAHVLVTLNGGQRAVDLWITDNPVIKDRAGLGDPMDCISPNNQDHLFLEEAHSFLSHLSSAFNAQVTVIDRVFPASVNVVVPYLQKLGNEVLASYIDTLFVYLQEKSTESYVRAISGVYDQSLRFAKTLRPPQASGDEFYEAVDKLVADIFAPYAATYFSEELALFKRRSEIEVSGWERQLSQQDASLESMYMTNINRQADKRDFLSSFKKVVMMPVNVLPSFDISSRFGGKSPAIRASDKEDTLNTYQAPPSRGSSRPDTPNPQNGPAMLVSRSRTPIPEPPTTELAAKAAILKSKLEGIRTLFSLEVALNLVHMAKSSIDRAAVFARVKGIFDTDARNECEVIFIMLLRTLGDRHVKAGFDQAVAQLANYSPRSASDQSQPGVAPLVMFLELVNVGDLIQQMLDVFYEQELVATRLTDRHDFLNPTVKEKKRFEQMLDERVAAGLNKGIEVLMAEVEFVCATTQNVEDFNPGATGMAINKIVDITPSNTAVWVVEVVSAHTKMLVGSTDKNMLDVFNQEIGLRLFATLCKHLKRQRISVSGSIKLISDMNHYFMFVQSLKNKDLLEYFKALRELAQIYLIDPSDAKELAAIIADADRFHGIFRAEEVYEYAERRADWYQVKSRVEKAMYGIGCCMM
ncbi:F-box protein: endocytic membrane traffic, recycling ReCYcling 1 [Xylographa vitiligo]|nr:F-box protein: endocytic membrane traffic, recycling ReCYcling 1 [Xylographa vitiligo]